MFLDFITVYLKTNVFERCFAGLQIKGGSCVELGGVSAVVVVILE